MGTQFPPKKNAAYTFYVSLVSQANTKVMQSNPTLAAGDVKVSTDGGALANLATLPVVTPASSKAVKVDLSASEMNGDNVVIIFSDAAGAEWCDLAIDLQTVTRQIDDLAYPATSGRSLAVDASGNVTPTTVESVILHSGTAQAGAASTITLAAGASSTDNLYVGEVVKIYGGAGAGQARVITAYNGTTKVATVGRNWTTNPDNASTYALLALAVPKVDDSLQVTVGAVANNAITAAAVATDAIDNDAIAANAVAEIQSGLATAAALATVQADTDDIQARLPAALVGGRIDASVGALAAGAITATSFAAGAIDSAAIATDAIGSAELAASAVTEIQTGLSTLDAVGVRAAVGLASANLDTQLTAIDDYIDTEVAAIKAKTDLIPAAGPASAADYTAARAAKLDNLDATTSSRATPAQVNTEVVDALAVDTYAEPGQGTPAATATLAAKINYLYKAWRNKKTQTSTQYSLYADDATTVDQKATVSSDGTTTTVGEVATGP
jgi:hypothetical protein